MVRLESPATAFLAMENSIQPGYVTEKILLGFKHHAVPVYDYLPGWWEDISQCRSFDDLPVNAQRYVLALEEMSGAPFWAVGGTFTKGAFVSNRTRDTDHPGYTETQLPIFVNASPAALKIGALEAELTQDIYTITLRDGWTLERLNADGTATAVRRKCAWAAKSITGRCSTSPNTT